MYLKYNLVGLFSTNVQITDYTTQNNKYEYCKIILQRKRKATKQP